MNNMGIVQKDAFTTTIISAIGLIVGYINKGVLFLLLLSAEEIGLLNLLVSVGLLFGNIINLGLINTVWRFFPYFRNEELANYNFLKTILKTVLLSALFYSFLLIFIQPLVLKLYQEKSKEFVEYFYLIIPIGIGNVLYLILDMYLRGMQKNTISLISNELIHRIGIILLLVLFALHFISISSLYVVFAFSYFIPCSILIYYLIKKGELNFKKSNHVIPRRFRKILIQYSLFNYLNSIGTVAVISIDGLMIASKLGLKETGIYTTIIYLLSAIQLPIRSLLRIGSSLVSQHWKDNDLLKMNDLYKKTSSISLIISLYTFLVIWFNVDFIFQFLPSAFVIGKFPLLFFLIGRIIDAYLGLNGVIFITSKKYKLDIYFTLGLLLMVIILNQLLIPIFGLSGAAISTSSAIIIYNVGRMFVLWRHFNLQPFEKQQLNVLLLFCFLLIIHYTVFIQFNASFGITCFETVFNSILYLGSIVYFKWNEDLLIFLNKSVKLLKKLKS